MAFESTGSKEIGWYFEKLVFQLFQKIGLTLANLKALANLFKDNERLQIPVISLARTLAPSYRNLPGMPAALYVSSLKILNT